MREGDHSAADVAAMRVNDNLWILDSAARHVMRRFRSVEYDELVSIGYIALRKAAENYDPTLGSPFGSFAWIRAAGAMTDVLRRDCKINARMLGAAFEAITLMDDSGDVMRDDEAQHRVTAAEYFGAVSAAMNARVLSSHSAQQVLGTVDDDVDHATAVKSLTRALNRMAPEHATLVKLHYMESTTLRSIADQLKVSYQTAKRRHNAALRELARAWRHASN